MKTRLYYTFVVGTAIAMGNMRAPAQAHNQPAITTVVDTTTRSPAQRALGLLKPAADRLSAAKAFSFKTEGMMEVPSPEGQILRSCFKSEVALQRPNRLATRHTGGGAIFGLYYDGKAFSAVDHQLGLFARTGAPASLDELLPFVLDRTGIYFPCADLLYSDVYASLAKDLTHAYWIDRSVVNGVPCDHLALGAPGVEWQIWVGPAKEPLPCRLMVTLLNMPRQPRFTVTFSEWNFTTSLPEEHFGLKQPLAAKQIGFRPLLAGNSTSGVYSQVVADLA